MASLLDKKVVKNDRKFFVNISLIILFFIWLFWPNTDRIAQISYWGNNIAYYVSGSLSTGKVSEYKHLRDNAIYMVRMYPNNSKKAIREIDKAIKIVPDYVSEQELSDLYVTRAQIKLFYGDKKGALNDYLKAKTLDINNDLRLAVLLADNRQYQMASEYCKDILNEQSDAFSGYACFAYVYEAAGRKDAALKVYDIAIAKKPDNASAYIERANLKKRLNDSKGYNDDIAKAKQILPSIDTDRSITKESVNSKINLLSTM